MPGRAPESSRSRVDDDGGDGTFRGYLIRYLRFSDEEVFMGEGLTPGEPCGPTPPAGAPGGGGTRAARWCGGSVAPLRLCFGLRIRDGKIGGWVFVPCNSENISCVGFLKRKIAENKKLALGILLIG